MSFAFLQTTQNTADTNSYTFSGVNFGAADATREIIVAFSARKAGATTSLGQVTIGGIVAEKIYAGAQTITNTNVTAIYKAKVPTGTSGDVVINFADTMVRCEIATYRVTGGSVIVVDKNIGTTTISNLAVEQNGFVIAVALSGASTTTSWSGVTEDYDDVLETFSTHTGGSVETSAAGTVSITPTFGTATEVIITAASFRIASFDIPLRDNGTDFDIALADSVGGGATLTRNLQYYVARTKIENLKDNFNDNSLAGDFGTFTDHSGTVTETNQHIEISSPATTGTTSLYGTGDFSINDSAISWEVKQVPTDVNRFLWMSIYDLNTSGQEGMQMRINNGELRMYKRTGDVATQVGTTITYNATTHRYLRFRVTAGVAYFEYSSNGLSWTSHHSEAIWFVGTWLYPEWFLFANSSVSTAETAIIDNVNTFEFQLTKSLTYHVAATNALTKSLKYNVLNLPFSEDLEGGSLPAGFDFAGTAWGSATAVIDGTSKVRDTYSVKFDAAGEASAYVSKNIGGEVDEIYLRMFGFIPTGYTFGASSYTGFLNMRDEDGVQRLRANLEDYGSIRLTFGGDVAYTDTGIDLPVNQVFELQIRIVKHATTGRIQVWLDNQVEGSPDYDSGDINTGALLMQQFDFGYYYTPEAITGSYYLDDFGIAQSFITDPVAVITKGLTYAVTSQTALTKSLSYEVTAAIAATKSLTYAVSATAALTKSLSYEVTASSSLTKSLTYEVTATQAATKSLTYHVLTSATLTKSLTYEVTAQAALTKSLTYEVLTTAATTKALTYAVLASNAIAKALTYEVTASQALSKALTYAVTAAQAITKALTYEVTATQALTKSLSYAVRTTSALTKSLEYVIAGSTNITKSLSYAVQAVASLTKSLTYRVETTPTATQKSLTYEVTSEQALTKSLTYSVVAAAALTKSLTYHVTASNALTKSLSYHVETTGAVTKSLRYVIAGGTNTQLSLTYAVQSAQSISKSLSYFVEQSSALSKSLTYAVTASDSIAKSLAYAVQTILSATKSLTYAVTSALGITKSLSYSVETSAALTKSLAYTVEATSSITKSLTYSVVVSAAVQKSLSYTVTSEASITKSLRYTVTSEVAAITKSLTYVVDVPDRITLPLSMTYRVSVEGIYSQGEGYYPHTDDRYGAQKAYTPKSDDHYTPTSGYSPL